MNQIPQALSSLGLPAMLVAFVVPLIAGLLTGTAAATLALSVPLVAPLAGGPHDGMMAVCGCSWRVSAVCFYRRFIYAWR